MKAVLYVHGKGGSASEAKHYEPLFPDCYVTGLDYGSFTPWETGREIRAGVASLLEKYDGVILIANSIGAFFSMSAGIDSIILEAYFISPIVDMERLIRGMMSYCGVTEDELEAEGIVHTDLGEDLSWEYLSYVRDNPVKWSVPTHILYGEKDNFTSYDTISDFAKEHGADLTVMKGGEHWFHTEEQTEYLDDWIKHFQTK